jgi:hypothetical protein
MKRLLSYRKLLLLTVFLVLGIFFYFQLDGVPDPVEEVGPEPTLLYPAVPLDGATNINPGPVVLELGGNKVTVNELRPFP